jgi:hypothetical protein
MPRVTIKAGTSQQFGEPGGIAEILQLFLERAGQNGDHSWEARIEEKGACSRHTPPVRVARFKRSAIYFRVKPAVDATTVFFVKLSIPEEAGLTARKVFREFKSAVSSFNRYLRTQSNQQVREPVMTSKAVPTVQENPSGREGGSEPSPAGLIPDEAGHRTPATPNPMFMRLDFETLTGVTRHPEKLRYVLTFVDQASKTEPGSAMAFKKALRKAAGWSDQPIRAVALVLAWLCKHDYVVKIKDQFDQVVNYKLTPRGASLALSGLGAASGQLPEGRPPDDLQGMAHGILPDLDPGNLLIRFREKAQELADAGRRLEANREKYRELQTQLKQLDEEYNEIARILVANREASALLCRLLELQGSVPMRP